MSAKSKIGMFTHHGAQDTEIPLQARVCLYRGNMEWNFPAIEKAQPNDIVGMMSHHTARFFECAGLERYLEGFFTFKNDAVEFSRYDDLSQGGSKRRAAQIALEQLYMAKHVHEEVVHYQMVANTEYDNYHICVAVFAKARVLFDMAMIDDPDSIRDEAEECPLPWSVIIELYDLNEDTPAVTEAERYLEIVRSALPLQQQALWPSLDIRS